MRPRPRRAAPDDSSSLCLGDRNGAGGEYDPTGGANAMHSSWVTMLAGVFLMAVALAAPSNAHHGWEDYQDTQFEITGTLATPVSLAGPHATAKSKSMTMCGTWCWPRRRVLRAPA